MFHYKVGSSGSVGLAEQGLSNAIEQWIRASYQKHSKTLVDDNALQSVFTTGWMPWLKSHPENQAAAWLNVFRDELDDHFTRTDQWYHGYWRKHEVGMGMAHLLDFMGGLWQMNPDDPVTIEMVVEAAEHLGNWVEDVPAWFDWDTGLFLSVYLGSDGPLHAEDFTYNIPQHMRALDLSLLAYRMSGQAQFLDLAITGVMRWAEAILEVESYPMVLGPNGGVSHLSGREAANYLEFIGRMVNQRDNAKARAFAVLSVGGVQLLLKLWQYSRDPRLLDAAEKTLDLLIDDIGVPTSSALVAAIRFYRNYTGRTRYDDAVLQTVEFLFPYFIETIDLRLQDMDSYIDGGEYGPGWRENLHARQHSPLLLGLAAEISGNERLATRTMDLAAGYLWLARRAFPDGRDNPYSAMSVSAITRGSAWDNGAGIVTEVWLPLRERFCSNQTEKKAAPSRRPFPLRLSR